MSMEQLRLDFTKPKDLALLSASELFDIANQDLLQSIREDSRFERKPAGIHVAALSEYFSMFANTKPDGGIIVIGMENDGRATGCIGVGTGKINLIERVGDIHCPDAKYDLKRIPVLRGDGQKDFLFLFHVYYHPSKVIKTVKQDAFIRRGESKTKLTASEVRELQLDKGEVELELEPVTMLEYPAAFDLDLICHYADSFRKSRGLRRDYSNKDILALRHLGELRGTNFVPNVACCLLFAKDPTTVVPGCKIRFLRFEGEIEGSGEEFHPVKDIWIEGNIPSLISEVEGILNSQLRDFSRLGDDRRFYTAPEYPPLAWHEGVVNACVHRSYGLRAMNVFVKMFDDRLVVESPGGFPGLVTPQNIYDMHSPRNPYLMDAMYYLEFVRCAHEGTRRIRDSMLGLGLPEPEFGEKDVSYALVRVTLRNSIKQRMVWIDSEVSPIVGEAISKLLTDHERRVINFLAENETINVSQVQRLTQRSWPSAKKLLEHLAEMGLLEHHRRNDLDRDPQAYYALADRNTG